MEEGKTNKITFTITSILLAFAIVIFLGTPLEFLAIFTQIAPILFYLVIFISSFLVGTGVMAIVKKVTDIDNEIAVASLFAIVPAAIKMGVILNISSILSKQLLKISDGAGSSNIPTTFNMTMPNYLITIFLLFVFFCMPFIILFINRKDKKVLLDYIIGLILATVLLFIANLLTNNLLLANIGI